jgi:hypothetical protein
VVAAFPNVSYLSFMRNPASPPLICASEEDASASQRYRLYVIHRLPKLQFLDAMPVSQEERKEAAVKGSFMATRKPRAGEAPQPPSRSGSKSGGGMFSMFSSSSSSGEASGASSSRSEGSPTAAAAAAAAAPEEKKKATAFLALGTSRYDGRHSEGNRFISDKDL